MPAIDLTAMAARIAAIELELSAMPHCRRTDQRREALERELARIDETIELGPVPSYDPAADPLYRGRNRS